MVDSEGLEEVTVLPFVSCVTLTKPFPYSQCQFSTSSQILYIIAFLKKMIAILGCVKWYFIEVLICISLKAKEIEYLFIFFIFSLSIYMSSLEKCLVNYLHRFFSLGHLSFYCRVL